MINQLQKMTMSVKYNVILVAALAFIQVITGDYRNDLFCSNKARNDFAIFEKGSQRGLVRIRQKNERRSNSLVIGLHEI